MRSGRLLAVSSLLALVDGASCAAPPTARERAASASAPVRDAIDALDPRQIVVSCREPLPSPPVPAYLAADESDRVLVLTAHPDDESMYGGGTIRRLVDAGHPVAIVLMTHGEGGRLLVRGDAGDLVERRDVPRGEVADLRDAEMAEAARRLGATVEYLYTARDDADYGFTTSCEETLERWESALSGGLRGALRRAVTRIREARPRVLVTLDPRDDPQASHHGHHKAVGVLAELAARLAASADVAGAAPHAIEELVTFAPEGARADVTVGVDPRDRLRALDAHASQFWPKDLAGFGARPHEAFVVRWRARGAPPARGGSWLSEWAR